MGSVILGSAAGSMRSRPAEEGDRWAQSEAETKSEKVEEIPRVQS